MADELKQNMDKAYYELERFLQTLGLSERQQEQLTNTLEYFAEVNDNVYQWLDALDRCVSRIDARFDKLGETDHHIGKQTLEERLNIIEGGLQIFAMSHLGHTNTADAEFREMHGFTPFSLKGDIGDRIKGMQRKLDKIVNFLEKFEVTVSVKEALDL